MALSAETPFGLRGLCALLDLPEAAVEAAWGARGDYSVWKVPKGDGRFRTLSAPAEPLKQVQRRILTHLLDHAAVSPLAHGFVRGRSIVTNARVHAATAWSKVSVDLQDAYPSVSKARVRHAVERALGALITVRFPTWQAAQRAEVFEVLAELCTHEGALPQGAPTSGALLNLACYALDRRCALLLRRRARDLADLRFSRYADDLTFTSSEDLPRSFVDEVIGEVRATGFEPNRRKVEATTARQGDLVICGVRLHDGQLTLPRKTLRRYRALFFQALAYDPQHMPEGVRDALHGALGFLTMVTSACPPALHTPLQRLLAHHGSWLRPPRAPAPPAVGFRYDG